MKIDVITTKKPLTKSLVNQMRTARVEQLRNGEVLGFVVNVVKDSPKSLLIHHNGDYFTLPMDYTKSGQPWVQIHVRKHCYQRQ